ncbi:MAG: hypothetical protein ACLUD2_15260 [Clostridium sp.]
MDMANNGIKAATGSIVYLDKSSKHMYELNNRIRLINVNEYPVSTSQGFIGFICRYHFTRITISRLCF